MKCGIIYISLQIIIIMREMNYGSISLGEGINTKMAVNIPKICKIKWHII